MTLATLHRWVGLLIATFLVVISITGVLLVWKPEYLRVTIEGADQPLQANTAQVAQTIETIVDQYPADTVSFIQVHPHGLSLYKVYLSEKRYAWHNQQGQQIQVWEANERLEDWLLDLHHRFLLGNTIGLNMAGFAGLLLLPMVIIGLRLWWPKRRRHRLRLWPKKINVLELLISHANLGAVSVVPFFLIGLTGVILVYPSEASKVLLDAEVGKTAQSSQTIQSEGVYLSTQAKLDFALTVFPNAKIRSYKLPNQWADHISVSVKQTAEWGGLGNSRVTFDDHQATEFTDPTAQTIRKRLFDFSMPLHTGYLPFWYRVLLCLFGAALFFMVTFGALSFTRKQILIRDKKRDES